MFDNWLRSRGSGTASRRDLKTDLRVHKLRPSTQTERVLQIMHLGPAGVGALASTVNQAAINARSRLDTPAPTEQGGFAARHNADVESKRRVDLKLDDVGEGAQQPQLEVV